MASGSTPLYLIPYPLSTDPVNVHGDMQLMATQIENVLSIKADKNIQNFFTQPNIFSVSSSTDAVRITQAGTGNALLVEDASNPDSTPFVIDASGNVGIGKTIPTVKLDVVGAGAFTGAVTGSTFNALTLTAAATGFTIAGGTTSKTLTVNNTLSFSGTDSTVMTFPTTNQTIAGLTETQLFTNKSLSDSTTFIVDVTDNTKRLQFDVTGTTGITGIFQTAFTTAKTVAFQDVAGTVYVSNGTDVTLADGGTNASLTAVNGGIVYSTASAMAISAAGSAGQVLRSGGAGAPTWSTATFPSTATTAGQILRADGTNWVATTATYPTTTTANQILFSSAANTIGEITTGNNLVLGTNASGVPSFVSTLPSGVTASSLTSFGANATLTTPTIDTINVSGAAITAALWNTTLTTGSISMGNALTTGSVNIANGTALNGSVNIGSGVTTAGTKTINLGATGGAGSTTNITIGSTTGTSTTTVLGTFKVGVTTLAQGVTGTVTLPASAGTLALNPTTTIGDIIYASVTGTPGTLARLAGNTAAQTAFLASTGNGTANTTTSFISSTGTAGSNVVLATSPTITTPVIDAINISAAGIAATLWNTTLTTGSIAMGGALTSGGITLAGGTTFAGTIAIANASTSAHTISISNGAGTTNKTINIGTGSTGGTTAIALGSSSGATSTIALNGAVTTTGNMTVGGDLTVNGTLTTINSNTITVDDKNLELGSVASATVSTTGTVGSITGTGPWTATITGMSSVAGLVIGSTIAATNGTGSLGGAGTYVVASIVSNSSITYTATGGTTPVAGTVTTITTTGANDTTANGGGITLKGTTDKTITWDGTNWTSNQPWNITTGNTFKINNVSVLSNTAVLGLTPTINATGYTLSGGTTPVAVTFAGGSAYTISGTNGQTYTMPSAGGTLIANPMTTLGDIIYGGASGAPTRLAGNTTNGIYFLRENVTASAAVAPDWIGSTGSGNVVLATSPSISGGTHTALTSLGIRDTSAAFDVTIAATSSPVLTAARTLTINMQDAARTISLAGNLTLGGTLSTASSFTTSGAFALTLTATNTTNATIPAGTVTLVDLSTSQALTNKTISGLTVSTTTGTLTIPAATIAFSGANNTTITTTGVTNATLPVGTTTLAANVTTTIGDIIYASATGTPGTLARLAGNTATQPSFLTSTGNGTTNTTTSFTSSTGSGNVVLATSPTIAGGSFTGLTGLAIRDTSAAFDVTIAATSNPILTAGRTLTLNMQNAARSVSLAGDISLGGTLTTAAAFTTSGAFATTITSTAITNATLPAGTTTLAANVTTTIGDVIYASATGTPGTLARLAGNTATQPAFLTSTGNGTANTTTSFTSSTGSGSVVLGTSPTISGGSISALTTLAIRDTSAAFDVTIAATSSTALTAGRTLTLDMVNAARTIKLAGNIDIAANFTTSGANALTLTTTGSTNVTLPTTGTLATNVTTTLGDLIYASATGTPGTLARLAGNITATKQFLVQTGTGTISAAPAWGSIADGDLPSALTGKSYNGLTLTSTTGTFTLTNAKTFAVQNTMTLSSSADGNNLNIGTGGTLGSAAFTASTAYISSTLMTTLGDMIYGGASGAATRLPNAGTTNGIYILQQTVAAGTAGAPSWLVSTGTGNNVLATSPTITTPVIDSITTSLTTTGTASLWNTGITSGTISIGGAISGGTISIGTGSVSGNKTIGIGTSATAGTTAITIGSNSGATSTIALNGTTTISSDLTVGGNLTVNGTLTTVNSNVVTVDDKNLELGSVPSATVSTTGTVGSITGTGPWTAVITGMSSTTGLVPGSSINATAGTGTLFGGVPTSVLVQSVDSLTQITYVVTGGTTPTAGTVTNITTTGATDVTANGGGITLKGTTDKTIIWDGTNWSFNQPINTSTGNTFKINNTSVLSSTAVLGLTPTINAIGFRLSGGTTAKYVQINNDIVLAGTDGSTLNIGAGGTLGSAAFTASTAYATSGANSNITSLSGLTTALSIAQGGTGTGTAPTQWGVIYAATTTGYASTGAGATGQVLIGTTGAAPSWSNASGLSVGTATNLSGTTVNSIPYQSASGTTSYISIGSANQLLAVNGTANGYTWVTPFTNPMTTLGDMIYGGASGASTRLANAGTTNGVYILQETVSGGAAAAPSWLGTTGSGNVVLATNPSLAGATLTAQLQSTLANNAVTGSGQIYLNGATGNRIDFNQNGVAAPAFNTRSAGTKIALWPNVGATTVDYAIGIETGAMWHSVSDSGNNFRWYAGTTNIATLSGTGALTANSFVRSGGTSTQYLMADGSVTTTVNVAGTSLTGSTLATNITASSLTSVGTLSSLSVSGTATFSSTVTVPTPTNNTDAANKAYVDSVLNAGVPDIIPLDDISGQFDNRQYIFEPRYQGIKQTISNPLRLQLGINGIIQYVDFPDYVWQSPLPREGFQINNDGNIMFSEAVPAGSRFDATIQPGPNTTTRTRIYPFKAVDILLGG